MPAVEEEVPPVSFLAAGSHGQVYSVENLEPDDALLLRAVEGLLQAHATAQPLNLSHCDYRRGTSFGEMPSPILQGREQCQRSDRRWRAKVGLGWRNARAY